MTIYYSSRDLRLLEEKMVEEAREEYAKTGHIAHPQWRGQEEQDKIWRAIRDFS